jgi:glycosidase
LSHWADDAFFYHVYPLGLTGAPPRNDFQSPPVPRLAQLGDWLPHVRDLGANALYLGPVFESTAHGYDTVDYWHVDRRLGTDETLAGLVAEAHRQGIRVILDGVFNHTGRDFWAFRDIQANGTNSPYSNWYAGLRFDGQSPYGDPFVYQGWHGRLHLPKLNTDNAAVREHLFGAVSSWIERFDIDGLRLDAADVLDLDFQRALAAQTRARKSDFWLLGEVVHGDYRRWANPSTLDSVTNYEAYKGLYSSLNDRNYFEIAYALNRQFGPEGMYRGLPLYNFVDNHDVDRIAGMVRREHLFPLHVLLFTMPGVPSIYYGSEWAIEGRRRSGDDSAVRPALDPAMAAAAATEPGLPATIARLARIRAESEALRRGSYRQLHVASEQLAFTRESGDERVVVMLNSAEHPAMIPLPVAGAWTDLLTGERRAASKDPQAIEVSGFGSRILRADAG